MFLLLLFLGLGGGDLLLVVGLGEGVLCGDLGSVLGGDLGVSLVKTSDLYGKWSSLCLNVQIFINNILGCIKM